MPKISGVVITLNEEQNIRYALESLAPWVDEIIVVDMHSDDRTVEIAESLGATVYSHPRVGFADPARPFAIEKASGDWIMYLDADEIVPRALSDELLRIARTDLADVCNIPRLNYFGNSPLMYNGWGPDKDRQLRFYKKGALFLSSTVTTHQQPQLRPGRREIDLNFSEGHAIIHFNYLGAAHFLEKLNRYTDIEAAKIIETKKWNGLSMMIIRPFAEFVKRYFVFQGFRDGWAGFYYSFAMVLYKMTSGEKARSLRSAGTESDVRTYHQTIADGYLREYAISQRPMSSGIQQ